ncbi:uncharacterized protein B0H64DRAFT_203660, partial [Chaetomium fimeti]
RYLRYGTGHRKQPDNRNHSLPTSSTTFGTFTIGFYIRSLPHLHLPSLLLYRFRWTKSGPIKTVIDTLKESGALNEKLEYQPKHTIHNKYMEYKAADRRAGEDRVAYNQKANELKVNGAHEQETHKQLAPLAAAAYKSAKIHADKRRAFNERYKDVLVARGRDIYKGHVEAAKNAEASSKKYAAKAQTHQKDRKR